MASIKITSRKQQELWDTMLKIKAGVLGNEYAFPPTLSNDERKFVHGVCSKFQLKSKSSGKGSNRFLTVFCDAESIKDEELGLLPFSLDVRKETSALLASFLESSQNSYKFRDTQGLAVQKMKQVKRQTFFMANEMDPFEKKISQQQEENASQRIVSDYVHTGNDPAITKFRKTLPAFEMRRELLEIITANQITVISGDTGCGKSTQIPQMLLDNMIGQNQGQDCHIICTQPRRISAIALAERVAEERGERVGGNVGYQIRLERKSCKSTKILFCTIGILLRRLVHDRRLSNVSHLVIDEVHERDKNVDFLLIILRDVVLHRPDLKVVLMSATLQADKFSRYFGGCAMASIPGRLFSVKIFHLEDVLEMTSYSPQEDPNSSFSLAYIESNLRRLRFRGVRGKQTQQQREELQRDALQHLNDKLAPFRDKYRNYSERTIKTLARMSDQNDVNHQLVVELVVQIVRQHPPGAILIFCPGWKDIQNIIDRLGFDRRLSRNCLILPLHGSISSQNQRAIFKEPPKGVRKIVVSTNLAETSITINDVVYVIDTGLMKEKNYDSSTGMSSLLATRIARANADQRKGRAGRVSNGVCYRMYTSEDFKAMSAFQTPELLRTPLQEIILQVKLLLRNSRNEPSAAKFLGQALEPPEKHNVDQAMKLLHLIGALSIPQSNDHPDAKAPSSQLPSKIEELTTLGEELASLPIDPRLGKMMLYSIIFKCFNPVLTIASCLGYRDPFVLPLPEHRRAAEQARQRFAGGTSSDCLTVLNAFIEWKHAHQQGHHQEKRFCEANFLSLQTMRMVGNMRKQFFSQLKQSGFIPGSAQSPDHDSLNSNSHLLWLVDAICCSGIYPNIAKIGYRGQNKKFLLSTRDKIAGINIHPSSINARVTNLDAPFLGYFEAMRSSQIFLQTTMCISPLALILFGGGPDGSSISEGTEEDAYTHFAQQLRQHKRGEDERNGVVAQEIKEWVDPDERHHKSDVSWFDDYDDLEDAADEFDNYLPAGEVDDEDIIDALVDLTIDETKEPEIVASASLLAAQNLDLESDSQVVAISKLHIDDWLEMTAPTATIEMLRALRVRVDHMIRLKFAFPDDPERGISDRLCQLVANLFTSEAPSARVQEMRPTRVEERGGGRGRGRQQRGGHSQAKGRGRGRGRQQRGRGNRRQ